MKKERGFKRLFNRDGVVMLTVIITMTLLILLAASLYMTLTNERIDIVEDAKSEQLYQTAVSVNDWVFGHLDSYTSVITDLSIPGIDPTVRQMLAMNTVGDFISTAANIPINDDGSGVMGEYTVTITLTDIIDLAPPEVEKIYEIRSVVTNPNTGEAQDYRRLVRYKTTIVNGTSTPNRNINDDDGFFEAAFGYGTTDQTSTLTNHMSGINAFMRTYFGNSSVNLGNALISSRLDVYGNLSTSGGTFFRDPSPRFIEMNVGGNLNYNNSDSLFQNSVGDRFGGIIRVGNNFTTDKGIAGRPTAMAHWDETQIGQPGYDSMVRNYVTNGGILIYVYGNFSKTNMITENVVVFVLGNFELTSLQNIHNSRFYVGGNIILSPGGASNRFNGSRFYHQGSINVSQPMPGGTGLSMTFAASPISHDAFEVTMKSQLVKLRSSVGNFPCDPAPVCGCNDLDCENITLGPLNVTTGGNQSNISGDTPYSFRAPTWNPGDNPYTDKNQIIMLCPEAIPCAIADLWECEHGGREHVPWSEYQLNPMLYNIIRPDTDVVQTPGVDEYRPIRNATTPGATGANQIDIGTGAPSITITGSGYIDTSVDANLNLGNDWNDNRTRHIRVDTNAAGGDVYIRLCENNGPGRFKWIPTHNSRPTRYSNATIWGANYYTNITVTGPHNVIFFLDDGVMYDKNPNIFIGHEDWLAAGVLRPTAFNPANTNLATAFASTDPGGIEASSQYSVEAARYFHSPFRCNSGICVYCYPSSLPSPWPCPGCPCDGHDGGKCPHCNDVGYHNDPDEFDYFGRFLIRQDGGDPLGGAKYGRLLTDFPNIHNNIFLVDDAFRGYDAAWPDTAFSGILSPRSVLFGFVYAPGTVFCPTKMNINGVQTRAYVVGGTKFGNVATNQDFRNYVRSVHTIPVDYSNSCPGKPIGGRYVTRGLLSGLIGESMWGRIGGANNNSGSSTPDKIIPGGFFTIGYQ
jgi:hypothetical protein